MAGSQAGGIAEDRDRRGLTLVLLVGFWGVVALVAGTVQYLSLRLGDLPVTWARSVSGPLAAGFIWVPLTLAIAALTRRVPPFTVRPFRAHPQALIAHVVLSVLATFVLNSGYELLTNPAGFVDPTAVSTRILSNGLQFLHFNAATYWMITAGVILFPTLREALLQSLPPAGPRPQTLTVRSGTSHDVVHIPDIRHIEGAGDYVRIHTVDGEYLHSERLKRLESSLDPEQFVRVHRSTIVNVETVERLTHLGHGDYEARLDTGTTVRVSRTRRARLAEVMHQRELCLNDGADER